MAPLGVDPGALDTAGSEVVTAAEGLGSVISALTAALSGCAGMAGDDPAGAAFGHSYDGSAAKLVEAMAATRNGLASLGDGVRMSAHNYSVADAMSNVSGRGSPLPIPAVTGPVLAGSPPSSVGTGTGAPAGWGWVAPYIGMIWPTADSAKLRAAASAWSAAGTRFAVAEILGTGGPMGAIRAQQIPEGALIDGAFTDAFSSTTHLVQQCQKIAAQLNSYAAKVDKVHAAILDLLARICDPLTGIKEVWEFLTDEDEDEIKKIADDIRAVVDNFRAEVDALRAEIASALAEAVNIATDMGRYAERQWDQFLHATEVGRTINQVGQYGKGAWSEAGGIIKGVWDISSFRMMFDPIGYGKEVTGQIEGALPLVGLGGDGAPGWRESWKELGKSVVHWDEWDKNPAEAAGRTVVDLAALPLPGGPLSKLFGKFRALADSLRAIRGKPPEIPKIPPIEPPKPPVEPLPSGPKPPEPHSPPPGPPAKPAPGPANGPLPHSPTETKPPVVERPPAGEPPRPVAVPPASAGKPPVPADLPHPHEQVPAQIRAAPADAGSAATHAQSAPHLPSAPAAPTGGGLPAGAALPQAGAPHGGSPHGGEPGAHEPHQPHDGAPRPPAGTPHPPGDGTSQHQPSDGNGHHPHDGSPHEPGDGGNHPPTESPLTPDDVSALADYTGPGYQELNDALRNGALDASHQARVDAINRALEKLPAYEGPVIRGTNVPADVLDRYQPGRVITEPAFTSTTTLRAVAEGPAFAGNVEFRIFSTTGRDVSSFSMYPGEQEVLFPPGAKFYIVGRTVDQKTGRTIIEMLER